MSLLCVLMAVIICAGCCVSGYLQYQDSIYKSSNDFAYEIGQVARSFVNGDKIASYLETKKTDAEYDEMVKNIYNLYKNTDILYKYKSGIYIFVPDCERFMCKNVFDVRIVEATDETRPYYEIGVEDPITFKNPQLVIDVYQTGKRSSDYFIHESKFGYNSCAILPVFDSNNNPTALIVADMPMPTIEETLAKYLISTILITVLIVAIFMAVFIIVMMRTVTRPTKIIAKEAQAFTESDIQLSTVLPQIKQKDEIGQLAGSIYKMEQDIQSYVENLTAVTAEKERIGAELDVAKNIQASMLPCIFPPFPEKKELDIFASMTPAKEVGGDFYDFFMVDEKHIAIVMADVSGKGVPAALFMVIGKTLIKDHTQLHDNLSDVFSDVNNLLCEANSQGLFITAFEGVLDLETGEFNFVNAGHEMPFIYHAGEGYKPEKIRPGFVLAGMEDMKFKGGTFQLNPGDKIFQYTDGVTEATNADNKLFGMERLEETLNKCCDFTPEETVIQVKADVDEFVGEAPQFDDITMLCLHYKEKYTPNNSTEENN
ncbi:MAG: SpoIIE family protein phosphatase [Oscillospiraceae bacterium]|nr:SpoIIE family protein phosphatase [Candidatus Equicaccousia limihippi]